MSAHTPAISDDPLKEKLIGYLAADVSQSAAALACGVTDGYVSQLLEDPEFLSALAGRRTVKLEAHIKHDETVESIEQKALAVIEAKLPFVRSAVEAAKVFQVLNTSKRRTTTDGNTGEALGAQNVTLVLPRASAVQLQFNDLRQVVEVNGRSMATLPSRALPSLTAAKKLAQVEQAAQDLKTKDAAKASEILDGIGEPTVHKTMINGVLKVV